MRTTVVIIGAGHAGLAMSRRLTDRSIDHVVIERGEVANSWRTERWASLRLLTPNWQTRSARRPLRGRRPRRLHVDARGDRVHRRLRRRHRRAGDRTNTTVTSRARLATGADRYEVCTDQGVWTCAAVVLASGACNLAVVPAARCRPSRRGRVRHRHGLPLAGPARRGRRARRRRLGHRCPARRRDPTDAVGR